VYSSLSAQGLPVPTPGAEFEHWAYWIEIALFKEGNFKKGEYDLSHEEADNSTRAFGLP
jgi:hypothetical protein